MSRMSNTLRTTWQFVLRVARMARTLMTSRELPLWLRGMYAVILLGTQFMIGPLDDVLLLLPVGITYMLYRPVLVSAWRTSAARTPVAAAVPESACWHWAAMTTDAASECVSGCKIMHCPDCEDTYTFHSAVYRCQYAYGAVYAAPSGERA